MVSLSFYGGWRELVDISREEIINLGLVKFI